MIREAIQEIQQLTRRAFGAEVIHDSRFPRHCIIRKGDELTFKDTPLPMRKQAVVSVVSLVNAAKDAVRPQFWVNRSHVLMVPDGSDPREWVAMPLYATHPWKLIRELERGRSPGKSFSPRECLRFFRHEMGEAAKVDSSLAGALSVLDFKRMTGLQQGATRDRDTFGRSVEVEVQNAAAIPEETTVRVPMFNNAGLMSIRGDVAIDIILDPEKECVRLVPKPDHVVQAELLACEKILEEIRDHWVGTAATAAEFFVGTPVVSIEGLPTIAES